MKSRAKKTGATKKSTNPPTPKKRIRNYKAHTKKELSEAFPEIVDSSIERAKHGSLTHTKFLIEMAGVKDERTSRGKKQRHVSLAEMLMKELAKRNDMETEVEDPKDQETQAQQHGPKAADTRSEDEA
ncbi:MAG TPA: hypothetical protein VM554_10435 [Acidisarcina sp.]|nr:hypothetical protein [Acidisarcina sp.]